MTYAFELFCFFSLFPGIVLCSVRDSPCKIAEEGEDFPPSHPAKENTQIHEVLYIYPCILCVYV